MHRSALPLGLLLATLAGCASTESTGGGKPATPAYVGGTWMGGTTTGASTFVMVLKQTGNKVSGTLTGAGPNVDGPIEGSVDSNSIQLSTQSGYRETPLLRASCERISGLLSGTAVDMRRATPYTVDGTWMGSTARGTKIVVVLQQMGSSVTGTLTGAGPVDGPIEGTTDGKTIKLKERGRDSRSTPELKLTCEEISGPLYDGSTVSLRRIP
jgi:hypothetical protein